MKSKFQHIKKFQFVFLLVVGVFFLWFIFFSLPRPLFQVPYSTVLFSSDGQLMGGSIAEDGQWRFPENDSVPNKFRICITQFEDAWFDYHPGVNPVSLARAFRQNMASDKIVSGGSTISMQTIRLAKKNPRRTYFEKIVEMLQSLRLEISYSKESILKKYVAHAPFGGNVVGLDAASWRYFGKLPHQLSWSESATLAVLPNAPSIIFPGKNQHKLELKRNGLLKKLKDNNFITEEDYNLALLESLPQKPNALPQMAYHLLHTASQNNKGERISSTLNSQLQNQLNSIAKRHHQNLQVQEIHNLAILVTEVETGDVKAYIGNVNNPEKSHSDDVDIVKAHRSSGSILKPFLYENMLHRGELLPNMLLDDTPSDITENYDKTYDGLVPAEQALSRSLNVPAIDMLQKSGIEKFYHQLKKLEFSTLNQPAVHYGLSLIVGGAEVSLWDLSRTYRNMVFQLNHPELERFSTDIQFTDLNKKIVEKNSAFDVQAVYLTMKAMQQVVRPTAETGWHMFGKNLIAWKTGTSHGFRDAWAVGMTPEYVVSVWVGNADGEGRPGIIGLKAAAPILFDVFQLLPTDKDFVEPTTGWVAAETCSLSGYKSGLFCSESKIIKVPALAENMPSCPYHHRIHLDATGWYRVNSDCYSVSDMVSKDFFVLPPVQEWYFQKKNVWYQKLPAFHPSCENDNSIAFALIYPKNFTRILLPIDFEGKRQPVVFQLAHRHRNQRVFWYLDHQYIGETIETHHMPLTPEPGEHTLILSDESGNRLVKKFRIVE
ncbi:MAG: penicillin-binding protein 1C [Flavobacteriaceae bacterium]|nr:penicillin-binding protein 1C [Flavobacteriaceae bacterium]